MSRKTNAQNDQVFQANQTSQAASLAQNQVLAQQQLDTQKQNNAISEQELALKQSYTDKLSGLADAIPSDYSDAQKSDIRGAEMGGIDVGFGNMKDEMMRRSSATGSFAGLPETLMESGTEAARQKADAGQALEAKFADVPVQRALQKASIFQPAISGMLYARPPASSTSYMPTDQSSYVPNQPSTFSSIMGAVAGAGATVGGKAFTI